MTERQTERGTDRHPDTETHRHTNKETHAYIQKDMHTWASLSMSRPVGGDRKKESTGAIVSWQVWARQV